MPVLVPVDEVDDEVADDEERSKSYPSRTSWGAAFSLAEKFGFLSELQDFINKRHEEMPEGSYTTSLFKKGVNKMAQKVGDGDGSPCGLHDLSGQSIPGRFRPAIL